jgi:error-prone DNA polymerase
MTSARPETNASTDYVELRCRSAFSFLRGASLPEDLVTEAARLGHDTLALGDRDGVYGAPRFFRAARAAGIRPLVGGELTLDDGTALYVLVESRAGYRNFCRLVTRAKLHGIEDLGAVEKKDWPKKEDGRLRWDDLHGATEGLVCLAGGAEGPLARAAASTATSTGPRSAGTASSPISRPPRACRSWRRTTCAMRPARAARSSTC